MLNTFFFGYLPMKWKRLTRVLSVFFILFFPTIFVFWLDLTIDLRTQDKEAYTLALYPFSIVLIGLISWVLQPFVVKD